ncbi:hypothetical protein EJV47_16515 [Hymenobacter gummosus]|uniref:Uncharacterized protein n=1 Tax=Hymenobacter gummosus TaxID=1776032 RepID=A0A3S0J917_9BACT|nr:hypothetical protein [Hymenobacter gummosus]RTQ48575.1 hypothetical protein EJV47_16515 [Hymenobacter gummosus]
MDFDDSNDFELDEPRRLREASLRAAARSLTILTQALVVSITDDELLLGPLMLENAYIAEAKLRGARAFTNYGQLMEQAVLVKLAVQSLQAQTAVLRELEAAQPEHIRAIRDEIEQFRQQFADWVRGFDPATNDYDDGWGLFPPLIPPAKE